MVKILVTGGAGFIGSNLVDALLSLEHEVFVVDSLVSGKKEYINPKANFVQIDISDRKLESLFIEQRFDYVFHLAAQIDVRISVSEPDFDIQTNILGGLNILKNCVKYGVKKITFSSTGGAIYGEAEEIPTKEDYPAAPLSPYGINKLCFEKYLNYYQKVFGQNYSILRFANVYGPRQYKGGEAGVIAIFVDKAVKDEECIINGDGLQTRDFVYVDDVVRALIKTLDSKYIGAINIGTGVEKNLLNAVSALEKALHKEINKSHGEAKVGEQERSCLDVSLAKEILDWQPEVDLEEGIKRTIKWSIDNN